MRQHTDTEPTLNADFVCPDCSTELCSRDARLQCRKCARDWPVVDGIPHFVQEFPYWGEMSQAQMQQVNRRARSGNWRDALLGSGDPAVLKAAEMILNMDRAKWHWLADVPRDSRVLDLGAGTGTNAHGLGLHYRQVVAVEPVIERVEFMRLRFEQERLTNVKPVRSSLWVLPFSGGSFDMVAMNGVLEWVATGLPGDPRELQMKAIRNVYHLLRPGGCFYLGIENRLSAGLFLGYNDPHCGLPWVTVLPRPLAHWYARRHGQEDGYRQYLYSSRGYRRLLEDAGFKRIEIFIVLPSYNHPRFLMPLDKNIFNLYYRNFSSASSRWQRRWAVDALLATGLLKYMQHSFAIFAYK